MPCFLSQVKRKCRSRCCRRRLSNGSSAGLVIGLYTALSVGTDDSKTTRASTDRAILRPFRADPPYWRPRFTKPADEPFLDRRLQLMLLALAADERAAARRC